VARNNSSCRKSQLSPSQIKSNHDDLKICSFTDGIVNIWNSLPNAVVDVDSVDLFKSRLDYFWMSQDVKYDYTVNLAGTGDRSEYDTESF